MKGIHIGGKKVKPDVCVVLPTLNEAESIGEVIRRIRQTDAGYQICIVDSGSADGTVGIALSDKSVSVIGLREKGKGRAIRKAFEELDNDILVLLDSDATYYPEEIPRLLEKLGGCDAVVGSRFIGHIEEGSMKPLNRFGNRLLTAWANLLYGKQATDVCSGFWAFGRNAYKAMEIDAAGFALEANFFAECARKGMHLCEAPISYGRRKGETKLSALNGIDIALYLLLRRLRR